MCNAMFLNYTIKNRVVLVGEGGWRELVNKGIGKSGVEVIAVEMFVFIRGFTFSV